MSNHVSEELARKAVDKVVEACVDSQRAHGVTVPHVAAAEEFARDVVRRTIQETESKSSPSKPTPRVAAPPDKLSRGELGEGATPIVRTFASGQEALAEREKRKAPEDPRLRARLDFLGQIPEWHERLFKVALDGEAFAKRMGIHDVPGRMSVVADFVINEAEKSNAVFGDWRLPPKVKGPLIMVAR